MTDKELFDAIRARKGAALTQADVDAINRVIGPVCVARGDSLALAII